MQNFEAKISEEVNVFIMLEQILFRRWSNKWDRSSKWARCGLGYCSYHRGLWSSCGGDNLEERNVEIHLVCVLTAKLHCGFNKVC